MANFTFSLSDVVPDYMKTPPEPKKTEAQVIGEQAVEGPLREAVSALPWAQAATGFAPLFGYPTGYDVTQEQALTAARGQLGLSGQEPSTLLGKGAGAAVRTLTSPSTYYTAPLFGMSRLLPTVATAVPGAAGAEIGQEVGGLPGAVAGSLLFSAPGQLLTSGQNLLKNFQAASSAGGALTDLTQAAGGKRAATVAQKAFEADPTLSANLLRANEIQKITGVELPTTAAAQGSNVLLQEVRSQAAKSPEFLAQIRQQEADAKQAILKRAVDLFGKPSTERVLEATANQPSAVKSLGRRIDDIDSELATLSNKIESVDPTALGTRTANLVKAKEELARQEVSPLYENALKEADKAGIKLSADQTEALYSFVNSEVNKDVFKTFPTIYSKVNKVFGPKLVDEVETFSPASVYELDSLKKEINRQIYRGNASQDTKRVLENLKFELNTMIDELPASFRDAYRGADAEFLRRVGVPFDAKAISDIGSKKFIEETVPVLTKNPSAMNQFLDVAGEEGKGIIRDAFMYDLSRTPNLIDADGAINPKLLDRFIQKNKDTLKIVPDVADELRGLSTDSKQLLNTQMRLNQLIKAEQKQEANNLFNRINNKGLETTIGEFFTAPGQQAQILKELNKNPEALKGFRASVLEGLTTSGRTLDNFEANKDALNKLFGPTYIKNVEALAEATQALYSNPVKLNVPISTIRKTKFEETLGMSPESAVALARRQITSPFQKFTIGLSKFFQNKASQAESEAIQDFLLDPKKIKDAAELYQKIAVTENMNDVKSLATKAAKFTAGEAARRGSYATYLGLMNDFGAPEQPAPQTPQETEMQFRFAPPNPITQ